MSSRVPLPPGMHLDLARRPRRVRNGQIRRSPTPRSLSRRGRPASWICAAAASVLCRLCPRGGRRYRQSARPNGRLDNEVPLRTITSLAPRVALEPAEESLRESAQGALALLSAIAAAYELAQRVVRKVRTVGPGRVRRTQSDRSAARPCALRSSSPWFLAGVGSRGFCLGHSNPGLRRLS